MNRSLSTLLLALFLSAAVLSAAETRDSKVRKDRADVVAEGRWIYDDFNRGLELGVESGKPLLVVLRCVP